MALKLLYNRTFIDVQEGPLLPQPRSSSLPPRVGGVEWDADAHYQEKEMQAYVKALKVGALSVPTQEEVGQPSEGQASSGESCASAGKLLATVVPSRGSVGHPELCHRPCIYFASGHCESGDSCGYCHMHHAERPTKLDKKQRAMVQSLDTQQTLALMIEHLRPLATKQGFALQAAEIVALVEHELALHGQTIDQAVSEIPAKVIKKLGKTLGKMRFSAILGLASQAQVGSLFRQQLFEASERLRAAVPIFDDELCVPSSSIGGSVEKL
mmetsp:Transcript_55005/g.103049  ORF Transcript_55005/g.103049 Transcript_55005/m.103049 type:complete len:269 (+) Transcript_55005:94-900(+)